jgi:ribosomal-protein-alanine N-acetyltransferase
MIIRTEKLILKNLKMKDAAFIKKNISKKVIKWLPDIPWPYTLADARKYIRTCLINLKNKKSYDFGIWFKNDLIGTVSLYEVNLKHKRARLGYLLNRRYWGKGFMTEAVLAILYFGFYILHLKKIYTGVVSGNQRSLKLLKRLKFKKDGINRKHFIIRKRFYDEIILSLLKDEFPKHKYTFSVRR